MVRIRIEACENADEGFTFDGDTIAEVIATCVTEMADYAAQLDLPCEMANLLETIAAAMDRHTEGNPPIARHWDFSSPESAYYVMFWEDSSDDDGTSCADAWVSSGEASLDKAVRDIVSPGWDRVEA